jgi:hypothetical protein
MSVYATMLGAVTLSSTFVFYIWVKVLLSAITSPRKDLPSYQVLITSVGLVIYSLSLLMIMAIRIVGLFKYINLDSYIYLFYIGMVCSDILFLVSAALGDSFKQVKWLLGIIGMWLTFCLLTNVFN